MPESDKRTGPVERAVRRSFQPGQVLHTPTRGAPFAVSRIDTDGVVLLLGRGQWASKLTWECLEGVVPFIERRGGSVPIGGRHEVAGNPGTLDEDLKMCVKRTTAGWVASMLEAAAVLAVRHERPALVELAGRKRR